MYWVNTQKQWAAPSWPQLYKWCYPETGEWYSPLQLCHCHVKFSSLWLPTERHNNTTAGRWSSITLPGRSSEKPCPELTWGHQSHHLGVAHTRGVHRGCSVGHLTEQGGHSACKDIWDTCEKLSGMVQGLLGKLEERNQSERSKPFGEEVVWENGRIRRKRKLVTFKEVAGWYCMAMPWFASPQSVLSYQQMLFLTLCECGFSWAF